MDSEIWGHHRFFTSSMPLPPSLRAIPTKSCSKYAANQSSLHPHFHRLCWAGHLPSRKRRLVSVLVPCECLTFWTLFMPRIVFQILLIFSSDHLHSRLSSFVLTLSPYNSQGDLFLNMRDPFLHQDLLQLMAMSPNPLPCLASPTHCCFMVLPGALTATSCYLLLVCSTPLAEDFIWGSRGMAQWIRALAALPEDTSLILSTHRC